jgi:hypothetical protein
MTGQVKEGVLARFGELGVTVSAGRIAFKPRLLKKDEFAKSAETLRVLGQDAALAEVALAPGQLGFSYCQVPVVYTLADEASLTIHRGTQKEELAGAFELSSEASLELVSRRGTITRIDVSVPKSQLL